MVKRPPLRGAIIIRTLLREIHFSGENTLFTKVLKKQSSFQSNLSDLIHHYYDYYYVEMTSGID